MKLVKAIATNIWLAWLPSLILLCWLAYGYAAPTTWWIDIGPEGRALFIANAAAETDPAVTFTRTIKKRFNVRWHATLRRSEKSAFVGMCSHWNEAETSPGHILPAELTLGWFFEGEPCSKKLEPGVYELELIESWDDMSFVRSVSMRSNAFTIR